MTDRVIIKAELQNLQKILEAKADMCIGTGKTKVLSFANACRGALELLKEREAQPAIIEGSDVIRIGRCPSCKTVLQPWGANYCYKCGQAVKWDE